MPAFHIYNHPGAPPLAIMRSKLLLLVLLGLLLLPATLLANEYYVSTSGNNSNAGTRNQPWRTIQYAVDQTVPGDIVFVEDGVYPENVVLTRSGTPQAYITLRSVNKWGAKIEIQGSFQSDGIKAAANYLIIDGFEIYDPNLSFNSHGNGITVYNNHHVQILNNRIYDCGGSGIQLAHFDHVLVENNEVFNNAKYNPVQSSGISLYQARAVDNAPGYHIIVRNNRSYGNINLVLSGNPIGTTDGNGILVDDFHSTSDPSYGIYPHRTLIENNLSYDNGGKGVQVFQSDHVDLFNNTAYHNNHDTQNTGTWRAELSVIYSNDTVWRNNIGVANPGSGVLEWNRAILIAESENMVWDNNITYSGTPGDISVNFSNTSVNENDLSNNLLGVDPLFANAGRRNFALNLNSPAINAGSDQIISFIDINYQPRPAGSVDIGAFEFDESDLPVELTAFDAVTSASDVLLTWETASELNNAGFYIEMQYQGATFVPIAFIEGHGTTQSPRSYAYTLSNRPTGAYVFRLKQIDFDGTFAYSPTASVSLNPSAFVLNQSYPNPFNPQTRIEYTVPVASAVHLDVYNLLGEKIQTLVQENQAPGTYSVLFDAGELPNGTYVYRLTAGTFEESKTMVLLR